MPSDQELATFYQKYSDFKAPEDVTYLNAKKNVEILRKFDFSEDEYTLDFGTGGGEFVEVAGEKCYGVDFKENRSSRIFKSMDALPIKKFGFITLWGVLEHLKNPASLIEELSKKLNSKGKMVITTVDAESVIPYYYKPIEHLTYWTRNALNQLFNQCGLDVICHEPYFMYQRSEIYLDRLLSRTPAAYQAAFSHVTDNLPEYVKVPTNETFVVAQLRH
ncbi:MAG: class I SAM-dependent methyltransferase [Paludibacterium sp.]|uniref:class I SAM-dependent methyltransferase n=1 Tax=Paludibacterium sp. TaxID=1917523 RepID=UPI0025E4CF44|nr:class I SAM-dependent methyltransferase [Paludibacterium sp.]MBV8046974.1 class I SAM-dependent methyltransferase [Paludibacterium sp.]MBV8648106.1 class I SAM-dependent methyltransferase [Paludibacterium sp.]